MKSFGKFISLILAVVIFATVPALAADNMQYADSLYELALFRGTDKGYELEKTFTREEAATILVRLLGEEKNSEKENYTEIFIDVEKDRWSFPYVMYCLNNNITKGTGSNTFSPNKPISAEEFVTLVLRLLGYTDAEPETALEESVYINLLNSQVTRRLSESDLFTRNEMVYIVYRSLMTKNADGNILANELAQKGVITENEAKNFDVYNNSNSIDELLDKFLN